MSSKLTENDFPQDVRGIILFFFLNYSFSFLASQEGMGRPLIWQLVPTKQKSGCLWDSRPCLCLKLLINSDPVITWKKIKAPGWTKDRHCLYTLKTSLNFPHLSFIQNAAGFLNIFLLTSFRGFSLKCCFLLKNYLLMSLFCWGWRTQLLPALESQLRISFQLCIQQCHLGACDQP